MADWWQWSQKREKAALTFAVVGVGRFGTAVCRELIINGADVLAADYSEKLIAFSRSSSYFLVSKK